MPSLATATIGLLGLTACTLPEGFHEDLWSVAKLAADQYAEARLAEAGGETSAAPADGPTEEPLDALAELLVDAPATPDEGEPEPAPQALPESSVEPPAERPAAATKPRRSRSAELRLLALRALLQLGEPK